MICCVDLCVSGVLYIYINLLFIMVAHTKNTYVNSSAYKGVYDNNYWPAEMSV